MTARVQTLTRRHSSGSPNTTLEAWSDYSLGRRTPSPTMLVCENRRLDRPKSTPSGLRVTFADKVKTQVRPNTATGASMRPSTATSIPTNYNSCDRVYQVEHEPTRKHNLQSHLSPKKTRSAPWQKGLDGQMSTYYNGPGYILNKGKNKFAMTIKMDEFWDRPEEPTQKSKKHTNKHDPIMKQLQDQIEELSLFLEEERLNHKESKRKASDELEMKIRHMTNDRDTTVRKLTEEYEEKIEDMRNDYETDLSKLKKDTSLNIGKMKGEIEFLQGSFESFKSTLLGETNTKWKLKEEGLSRQFTEDKDKKVQELKMKIMHEKSAEKAAMMKEHNREMKVMDRDHARDIEAITRRYSNAVELEDQLKESNIQLEKTSRELEHLKKQHKEVKQELQTTLHDYGDTKLRLADYEGRFNEKVQEIDEKYKAQIHDLMKQNTEVRRMYMKKCGQLIEEKTVTDQTMVDRIQSAKDTMQVLINSRHKANVSLAAIDPRLDPYPRVQKVRPGSAPGTRGEAEKAKLMAGETEYITDKPSQPPIMPNNVSELLKTPSAHLRGEFVTVEYDDLDIKEDNDPRASSLEDISAAVKKL